MFFVVELKKEEKHTANIKKADKKITGR